MMENNMKENIYIHIYVLYMYVYMYIMHMCIYVTESLCCTSETNTTL